MNKSRDRAVFTGQVATADAYLWPVGLLQKLQQGSQGQDPLGAQGPERSPCADHGVD